MLMFSKKWAKKRTVRNQQKNLFLTSWKPMQGRAGSRSKCHGWDCWPADRAGLPLAIRNMEGVTPLDLIFNHVQNPVAVLQSKAVYQQCSVSVGSVFIWASRIRIRIRHYLYGSGCGSVLWLLIVMLSLKTVVNARTVRNKQKKTLKKLIFYWHLESHCKKEQDPDP